MFERSLEEAERILAADKDIIVPVKKIWQQVVVAGKTQDFTVAGLADFTAMMEADPRFEFFPAHSTVVDDIIDPKREDEGDEQTEMELLGFYSGDRVKLRRMQLTPDVLGEILRTKVGKTMDALSKVWELRPQGDVDTEEKLLDILAQAQTIQQEVRSAFSSEKMKNLTSSLRQVEAASSPTGKRKAKKKATPRRSTAKPSKRKKKPARSAKKSKRTGKSSPSRRSRR